MIFTKKSSHIAYKYLLFFLVVTFANEVTCYFLKSFTSTIIFYNIYYYFRFIFLGIIFQSLLNKKRIINYFINSFYIISFFLFFFCLYLYAGISKYLHTIYFLTGVVFIIINCLLIFYQSLKSEEIINPLIFPFFLSSIALFLYFLGGLPFLGIFNFMAKKYPSLVSNKFIIMKLLSVMLYSLISVDYFLQWKRMKSISQY